MRLLADTHVHLYDGYDLDTAFSSALANLARLKPSASGEADTLLALFLAERHDCHAFARLGTPAGAAALGRHTVQRGSVDEVLTVTNGNGQSVHVVAGRQVATRERLEVLALATTAEVADGGDILETVERIAAAGGIPVLAWAPGKWLGRRGRRVHAILSEVQPGGLLIGDTAMRPRGWPTPRLMLEAKRRGFAIVAGTDPLPLAGEESLIGRYGIAADGVNGAATMIADLRALLADGRVAVTGRRASPGDAAARWLRLRLASRPRHIDP